jgi:hypothetical protein
LQTEIVHQPEDVRVELKALDLTLDDLLPVGKVWLLTLSNWSPNHPRVYRGLSAWAEGVKTKRDALVPKGWERSEERNYPLTIHPSGGICIALASGDHNTGVADANPSNKIPKGPRTEEIVEQNKVKIQMGLFDDDVPVLPPSLVQQAKAQRLTYILLVYVDMAARVIRSELSLPMNINRDGLITAWKKRIILSDVPFDGDPTELSGPKTPELDIEIKRKVA